MVKTPSNRGAALERVAMWTFFSGIVIFMIGQVLVMMGRGGDPATVERVALLASTVAVWVALVLGAAARFGRWETGGAFLLGGLLVGHVCVTFLTQPGLARWAFYLENALVCGALALVVVSAAARRPFFVFEGKWWPLALLLGVVIFVLFAISFVREAIALERWIRGASDSTVSLGASVLSMSESGLSANTTAVSRFVLAGIEKEATG